MSDDQNGGDGNPDSEDEPDRLDGGGDGEGCDFDARRYAQTGFLQCNVTHRDIHL